MTDGTTLLRDLLPIAFAVRLATAALSLAYAGRPSWCRGSAFAGSMLASSLSGAMGVAVVASGVVQQGLLLRHDASGLSFGYTVAPVSAWFLVVLAILAIPAALYSVGYLAHAVPAGRTAFVAVGFNVLLGTVELVLVADSVVAFLCAWELMTLTTAALVATEHEVAANRRAAYVTS